MVKMLFGVGPYMDKIYRLKKRWHPYVPSIDHYGPGCAVPWPEISLLAVGYTRNKDCPGNLEILNPDKHGHPDGGKWRILCLWQTGWMAIQSLITGEVIFSVPPDTLEEME
jgi:hypothetical protein